MYRAIFFIVTSIILCSQIINLQSIEWTDEYWTIEEWLNLHPEQSFLMEEFEKRVNSDAIPIQKQEIEPVKIAVIYPAIQNSDYWRRNVTAFRERLEELRVPFSLHLFYSKPDEDDLQNQQIKEALDLNPDYLVFTLDTVKNLKVINHLLAKGTPKLILQNITTPLKSFSSSHPLLYVGFDHGIGSALLADYFAERFANGAKWSLFYFTEGYVTDLRSSSFTNVINKVKNIKLSSVYHTEGQRTLAKKSAEDAMKNDPELKFIYSCATDVSLGIIDYLKENGLCGKIMVNGWGGGDKELEAIMAGEMDVTVMRMNDDAGVAMAEAVALDLEGKTSDIPRVFSGKFEKIARCISPLRLEELKKKAFRYSDKSEDIND
ncbi:MAG: substrate-binding domain-containing protein [Candidatus Cloacimonetes bacterium]|nr:substrate-binding domain-containing protein [Candidatus Cloacimonadota bacterium]